MGSFIGLIPTPIEQIDCFFELAPVSADDVVFDLGSGDGRLVFAAVDKGAEKAVGVELNPDHVRTASRRASQMGLENRAIFLEADVMDVDLSLATVIFCYLITAASAALKPKFERELRPGTRVVMESFPIPGWKEKATKVKDHRTFYLYQMPPEIDEK